MKKSENFLIFITFIFCIVFAEFGLRIFEDQNHSVYPKGLFVKDKKNGYKLAKNFEGKHVFQDFSYNVKTNKYGCFENEINRKNAEILIVGDSHVWGFVRSEDRYSSILRNKYNLKTYNCALTGSGTLQQKNIYLNLLENGFKPKIIILGYTPFNDIEDDTLFPEYAVWNGILFKNRDFFIQNNGAANFKKIKKLPITVSRKIKSLLHRNSSIYRYSYLLKNKLINKTEIININRPLINNLSKTRLIYNLKKENKYLFDQNIINIKEFANIARDNQAKLIIAPTPTNNKYCSQSYQQSISYINKRLKMHNLDIVNNKNCLEEAYFYPINGHLNKKGHKYMAEKISEFLSPL